MKRVLPIMVLPRQPESIGLTKLGGTEGSLYSVERTTGMDYWNGLLECPLTLHLTSLVPRLFSLLAEGRFW